MTIKAKIKKASQLAKEHLVKYTIGFRVYYPNHEERTESHTFRATKEHLVEELKMGCYVCGTHKNPEVHHWYCEWAYANAVDWEVMQKLHPDFDWENFESSEDFIDSVYNCVVLCRKHHRMKNHGIHMLPYPIWITQKFKTQKFIFAKDKS